MSPSPWSTDRGVWEEKRNMGTAEVLWVGIHVEVRGWCGYRCTKKKERDTYNRLYILTPEWRRRERERVEEKTKCVGEVKE